MPRLHLPSIPRGEQAVLITGDEARYLLGVLRMRQGEELTLFDSGGAHFRARIKKVVKNSVVAELLEPLPPAAGPLRPLVLLQGILKGQKMDLVVQKATELGVSEIVPLVTERSQIRRTRKRERWQKIAVEASRQSFRTSVPHVREPAAIREYFDGSGPLEGFIFWEEGGSGLREVEIDSAEKPFVVAVGPEGGFTAREVDLARESGLEVKSLGDRILRAETATLSALTIVQFILGEMG